MFLWIGQHLGFPGVLNLFRYITFRAGDSILVKGSNSIGLAALVEALTGGNS